MYSAVCKAGFASLGFFSKFGNVEKKVIININYPPDFIRKVNALHQVAGK